MVKGAARRVVVVNSPDPRYFEQAIFVLKPDAAKKLGKSHDELLSEARILAESYCLRNSGTTELGARTPKKRGSSLPYALYAAVGAAAATAGILFSGVFR